MSGILKLGSTTFGTENNGKIDLTNVGESEYSSTNHTWTLKAVDAPIVGTNYSTNNNDTSGQLAIYNGATKLWGVNESGWVVNPNVPSFRAHDLGDTARTSTAPDFSTYFSYTSHNHGNCYNTANGRFTAPIDGTYCFGYNLFTTDISSTTTRTGFWINGSCHFSFGMGTSLASGSNSLIYKLSAGDYITLGTQNTNYTAYWYASIIHSAWWAYLIG